ncbi:MAG: hypothetical protein LBC70_02210, partial [Chitinispirillales bacterium]|nr:hypothetical protein [Chitinispirillales bacterium]
KNPEDDQGLFGVIGYYGRVSRLNVTASYIEGGDYVGILAGGSAGVIAGCSTSGIVVGDSIVGGFTGVNDGMITGSYAAGSVRGRIHVGVFLGANRIGAVIGNFSSAAGLDDSIPDEFVGANWGGFVRSTFLDTAGGVGGYFASGKGTENEPYVISAKEHLKNLSMLVNMGVSFSGKYINLDRDITLNDTANWRQWAAEPPAYVWMPIGLYINQFDGTFDGGGHIISGVYIDNPKATIISLFGAISKNAAIKNIGVTASYIRGYSVVGGLVGGSYGATISNSYATSVVTGHDAVGGLMGVSHGATIRNSYATGAVTGRGSVGGLVGNNIENSTISNSYSTGTVKGNLSVGGLVGINRESIIKFSYTISTVTGCGPRVGPLVGCICPGVENSSYFNIETSGVRDNHRGTGRTTEEMKQRETFTGWKFNRIWGMDSAINDGYPHLLGMPDNPAIRKLEAILEDVGAETDDNEK